MKREIYLLLLLVLLFVGCNREGEFVPEANGDATGEVMSTRAAMTGGSDPYKLSVMQQALNRAAASNPEIPSVTLQPTDYYVRFLPQDTLQMDILEGLKIELFNHPLDQMEDYEEVEQTEATPIYNWLYSVVPADFVFPEGIQHEVLYGVFIQRDKRISPSQEHQLPMNIYDSVLNEALGMTGNAPMTRSTMAYWSPSARLQYVVGPDDKGIAQDTLPLIGAKVRVYYYSFLSHGITNEQGETGPICTTNVSVRYEIVWEDPMWKTYIGASNLVRTLDMGDKYTAQIDTVFTQGSWGCTMSGVHTGLYSYFHKNYPLTQELQRPGKRIRIALMDQSGRSSFVPIRAHAMYFYCRSDDRLLRSDEVMNNIFHELGHASHNKLEPWKYDFRALGKDGESWATGIEYAYMRSFFPSYIDPADRVDSWKYTRLVESLLANGFSLGQIQHTFHESADWDSWLTEVMREVDRSNLTNEEKEERKWIVQRIFESPNNLMFDLTDVIEGKSNTHKNQVLFLQLIAPAIGNLSVEKWEVVEGEGAVILDSNTKSGIFSFSESGKKIIRATVNLYGGHKKIYEKRVDVDDRDIIVLPENPAINYDLTFRILSDVFADTNAKVQGEWSAGPDANKIANGDAQKRSAVFNFSKSGEKTIKVSVNYPDIAKTVIYERKITVQELTPQNSFAIIDRPEEFFYDISYIAEYMNNDKIDEIKAIGLNHNVVLFYFLLDTYNYIQSTKTLIFSLPKKNTWIDYTLMIYYTVEGSSEIKLAELVVSNTR